jgi:hypothetical protein
MSPHPKASKPSNMPKGGGGPTTSPAGLGKPAGPANPGGTHTEQEDDPWIINIGDHPQRADSPGYVRSRALMVALVKLVQPWVFGPPPYQDHHGGGLWLSQDGKTPFLVLGLIGCEWSAQFCADPTKVDAWRVRTKELVAAFPNTIPLYESLGYHDGRGRLDTPIADATGVGLWVDSIFNASVPLPALAHTGVLPAGGGMHHYPKPIVDIEFFKRDDFTLWVTDSQGQPAAVTPVGPPGSGDGRVRVAYSTPGTYLDQQHMAAHAQGQALLMEPDHPLAQQAFALQLGPESEK